MSDFYSLYKGGSGEIEEKKSRFIATIEPVTSEEEATAFINGIKKQYWDARHNCSAFVVGDDAQLTRCSDDGEPSGTAGRPMLEVLLGEKITNAVVVVTRYFGGTLLGTGGLIRAYQGAVKEALSSCVLIKKKQGIELAIATDYNDFGKLQYVANKERWNIMSTEYAEDVTTKLLVETVNEESITAQITDMTAARAKITKGSEVIFSDENGEVIIFN